MRRHILAHAVVNHHTDRHFSDFGAVPNEVGDAAAEANRVAWDRMMASPFHILRFDGLYWMGDRQGPMIIRRPMTLGTR